MYFYIYFPILFYKVLLSNGENLTAKHVITVSDISEAFVTLLTDNNENDNKRIRDLKDKLSKINSYVVDETKYTELLKNACKPNVRETNFYNALIEHENYKIRNNTKSLYLALKEKMNRDDLLHILSERGDDKLRKSARRAMMTASLFMRKQKDKEISELVEKYLTEVATDDHEFNDTLRLSHYWDPILELEDRQNNYRPSRRIYKGEQTTIKYYPFVVSIHIMGKFWCGGALYWHDLVITSAACLQIMHNNRYYRENAKILSIRVGSNYSRVGGDVIDALEVFFHPGYNPKTLENNIALIRMERHVRMNYHRVPKLIPISHNENGISFSGEVMLLGWGVSKASGLMPYEPTYLQRKFLPVYPAQFCKEIYKEKFNKEHMFCAGTMTTGEGACSHDAGGPAVLNGELVGIISFGPTRCGFPDAPTVLTLVGFYSDWIETINETLPGDYSVRGRTTTTTEDPIDPGFKLWKATSQIYELRADMFNDDKDDDKKYMRILQSKPSQEYVNEDEKDDIAKKESVKPTSLEKVALQPISTKVTYYVPKKARDKNTLRQQNDVKLSLYEAFIPDNEGLIQDNEELIRGKEQNSNPEFEDTNTRLTPHSTPSILRSKIEYAVGGKVMQVKSSQEDITTKNYLRTPVILQEDERSKMDYVQKDGNQKLITVLDDHEIEPRNDLFLNSNSNENEVNKEFKNTADIPKIIRNGFPSTTKQTHKVVSKTHRTEKTSKKLKHYDYDVIDNHWLTNKLISMVVPKKMTQKNQYRDVTTKDYKPTYMKLYTGEPQSKSKAPIIKKPKRTFRAVNFK